MKKTLAVILGLLMLLWCSCTDLNKGADTPDGEESPKGGEQAINCEDTGVESSAEVQEEESENEAQEQYERYPVKLARIGGEIYYDTGEFSKMTPRCGTLDGIFEKVYGEYEVPNEDGGANFGAEDNYSGTGWQNVSKNTVEIPLSGTWAIFRKAESEIKLKPAHYKYGMRLVGVKPGEDRESEYLVFTNNEDMTFGDIVDGTIGDAMLIPVKYGEAYNWGLSVSVKDVSPTGVTLVFSQSGGAIKGELQTGTPFGVEMWNGSFWEPYDSISGEPLAWNMLAYPIMADSEREIRCDWSYVYGELPPGKYRIYKDISDFYHSATGYDTHRYYAEFEIEQ